MIRLLWIELLAEICSVYLSDDYVNTNYDSYYNLVFHYPGLSSSVSEWPYDSKTRLTAIREF